MPADGRSTTRTRRAAALLCAIAAASLAAAGSSPTVPQKPDAAPDPHWSASGCRHCHKLDRPNEVRMSPAEVEAVCVACHDGRRAGKGAHPSLRPAAGRQLRRPATWPLIDGKIGCITCHVPAIACLTPEPKPKRNPFFLRDYADDPLSSRCSRCHVGTETSRFNPHVMLDQQGGIVRTNCVLCHRGTPATATSPAEGPRADELRYRAEMICIGCHGRHVEWFEGSHINAEVPEPMRRVIEAATRAARAERTSGGETTRPARGAGPELVLPLGDDGRVKCHTCHNPHQAGVLPADALHARGGRIIDGGTQALPLRGYGARVCAVCHTSQTWWASRSDGGADVDPSDRVSVRPNEARCPSAAAPSSHMEKDQSP